MRVVILGASRFGAAIAERLVANDSEVVLIDKDRNRLEKLADRTDCGMIEGDGTLPTVLREAFRDENDVFIAVTNASDDNILASMVARSVGFGRVIPQIVSTELLDICQELDLDDVITPHATVAESLCAALEDDAEVEEEVSLHNQLCLKRVYVPEHLNGADFASLDLPDHIRGIAVVRDGDEHLIGPEQTLRSGDCLLFALEREYICDLDALFAE